MPMIKTYGCCYVSKHGQLFLYHPGNVFGYIIEGCRIENDTIKFLLDIYR
jgi:hypothetical protein